MIKVICCYDNEFEGREDWCERYLAPGETPEQAQTAFAEHFGDDFRGVEFYKEVRGGQLELGTFETLPKEVPAGCGIVVFVRASHNDGENYDWQVLAIPIESQASLLNDPYNYNTNSGEEFVAGDDVAVYSSLDSNSEATIGLPAGSWKFADGKWTPCSEVAYHY